ncbi:oligosaccharide flippase family protein [Amylibacter sp.]|nr:oligosaccharide flippase family protein [Amylibacter sp.]
MNLARLLNNYRSLIKSIGLYSISGGVSGLANILIAFYLSGVLPIEDFGKLGLALTVMYFLPQVIGYASTDLVNINLARLDSENYRIFLTRYISLNIGIFFIIFLMTLLFLLNNRELLGPALLLLLVSLTNHLIIVHTLELIQKSKVERYSAIILCNVSIASILTLIFFSHFELDWIFRLVALAISDIVMLIYMYNTSFVALKNLKIIMEVTSIREVLRFGTPLMFALGAGWLLNQSDRYIVLHYFDLKAVGIYSLAYSVGYGISIFVQAVFRSLLPLIYSSLQSSDKQKVLSKYFKISFVLNFFFFMFYVIFIELMYNNFLNDQYASSKVIVYLISLSFFFNSLYRVPASILAFYKKTNIQFFLLLTSAVTNILFSVMLVPLLGVNSAAVGTLMAYIFLSTISYITVCRVKIDESK